MKDIIEYLAIFFILYFSIVFVISLITKIIKYALAASKIIPENINSLKTYNNFEEVIQETSVISNFKGIIPLYPSGLDIRFQNLRIEYSLLSQILLVLVSSLITSVFAALISIAYIFLFGELNNALIIILGFGLLYLCADFVFKLVTKLYHDKRIDKKYIPFIAVYDQGIHFSLIKTDNNKFYEIVNREFQIAFADLDKYFFGEVNKSSRIIGKRFEFKKDTSTGLKGNIQIENGNLFSEYFSKNLLLSSENLLNIYVGK